MTPWKITGICLAALGLAATAANAAPKVTIGNARVVVRTVMGTIDDQGRKLALSDDVYHNETISTEAGSATELVFLDQTKLALGPNSSLVLDKVVYDPDPAKSSFVTTATKGVFRFVTGNLPKKSYTIHTPSATIGIRGTVFSLSVQPVTLEDGGTATVTQFTLEEGAADIVGCLGKQVSLEHGGLRLTVTESASGACDQRVSNL